MDKDYTWSLEEEIEEFKKQREKVRQIVGQIGGKPTFMKKIFNVIFILLVVVCFALSLIAKGRTEFLILEVLVLLVSAKFIYFLFLQAKITHFQFWILSSIEWRVNDIIKKLNDIDKRLSQKID